MNRKALAWCLVLIWIGVIYGLSSKPASVSKSESRIITGFVQCVADRAYSKGLIGHRIVVTDRKTRKAAHIMEYFVLSLLVMSTLKISKVRYSGHITLAMTVTYACLDELHQMSVPGRGPTVRDVLIDSIGILLGIMAANLVSRLKALK